jgi:Lysyl oxidase
MTRRWATRVAVVIMVTTAVFLSPAGSAVGASDRLPDLGMGALTNLSIDTTTISGHRLLRFRTLIANVGAGPFETIGSRQDTSVSEMTVSQRIYDDTGSYRETGTSAVMFYSGDGHDHWHVRDAEAYELRRLDNGVRVGTGAKHGFCYYDNARYRLSLAGAPPDPVYTASGCGTQSDLTVTTGLSVGWGDIYAATLPFQWIDITGLKPGHYRLQATADPQNSFLESNDNNNMTWVNIQLKSSSVKIVATGPVI